VAAAPLEGSVDRSLSRVEMRLQEAKARAKAAEGTTASG
jgi:hypothetical protein